MILSLFLLEEVGEQTRLSHPNTVSTKQECVDLYQIDVSSLFHLISFVYQQLIPEITTERKNFNMCIYKNIIVNNNLLTN